MLKRSSQEYDYKEKTLVLQKAANIVRSAILSSNTQFSFNGSFPQQCQQQSLPPKLKLLTSMLLTGGILKINSRLIHRHVANPNFHYHLL